MVGDALLILPVSVASVFVLDVIISILGSCVFFAGPRCFDQ